VQSAAARDPRAVPFADRAQRVQLSRRSFLLGMGAAVAGLGLAAWRQWPDEGLWNPCRPLPMPDHLARHAMVTAAWSGLDAAQVWDTHVHLLGAAGEADGAWVNPDMTSVAHPFELIHFKLYANAACADGPGELLAGNYLARLAALHEAFPLGARLVLLAMDYFHDEAGNRVPARTMFQVSDAYAQRAAARHPQRFEWCASIHPYRPDCVAALEWAAAHGARAVKWIPSMMGIDPASPRCDRFYEALARAGLPLVTHGGNEHPLEGSAAPALNNPLALRRALDHGVRVVIAHCAGAGAGIDTDRGPNGPEVENFALFARLMDDPRYHGRLYGDLAAVTEESRVGPVLARIVQTKDWQGRLLNGSDYPLPGYMPAFSLRRLADAGFLSADEALTLREIRTYNPLLFDFVLKRRVAVDGERLPPAVFETARHFGDHRANRAP